MDEMNQQMIDAAAAQVGQSRVLGAVTVALVINPDGTQGIVVNSTIPDLTMALGLLEVGKHHLIAQAQQPAPSKLLRASGNVPRTS